MNIYIKEGELLMEQELLIAQAERNPSLHIIWVNETEKIASFRKVDGYLEKAFDNHDLLMDYVNDLQAQWFRFQ